MAVEGEVETGSPGAAAPESMSRVRSAMLRLLDLGDVHAESHSSTIDGTRIHHLEAGQGEPLVLIHGAGGGAANWFRVMAPLARHFRVIAPDLPGFGLSGSIDPVAPLSESIAALLDAWMERTGIGRARVVGTSFGGLLGLRLALREPERVERLGLIAPAGLGREMSPWVRTLSLPFIGRWVLRPSRRGTAWVFERLITSNRRWINPGTERALVDYLLRSGEAGDIRAMARAYRLFCSPGGQRECLSQAELASLVPPVLIVWGEDDAFFPSDHGLRAASRIPDATFHSIPAIGHSPNWEAPQVTLGLLLSFLTDGAAKA